MHQPIKLKLSFLLIALGLAGWALSPTAEASGYHTPTPTPHPTATPRPTATPTPRPTATPTPAPTPDDCALGTNTRKGCQALFSNVSGTNDTALGFQSLFSNTSGSDNTATGYQSLFSNTIGGFNTANGSRALLSNIDGFSNTAMGASALMNNTNGMNNTATGTGALSNNTTGSDNTATGNGALVSSTTGIENTADGRAALQSNITGSQNTAEGIRAMFFNTAGNHNIALGFEAGGLIDGDNNIAIGNFGASGESNTIRIGDTHTSAFMAGIFGQATAAGLPVLVDSAGKLGTTPSAQRFKQDIASMDNASDAILALRPVTFHYKQDPKGIPQFGLVAEEVAKINPDLVVRDGKGEIYSVRYEAVNAMLLNEFLKEHQKVQKLEATVAKQQKELQATAAKQQKEIESLIARVKKQESAIQKVGAELEINRPASQKVVNNR